MCLVAIVTREACVSSQAADMRRYYIKKLRSINRGFVDYPIGYYVSGYSGIFSDDEEEAKYLELTDSGALYFQSEIEQRSMFRAFVEQRAFQKI